MVAGSLELASSVAAYAVGSLRHFLSLDIYDIVASAAPIG